MIPDNETEEPKAKVVPFFFLPPVVYVLSLSLKPSSLFIHFFNKHYYVLTMWQELYQALVQGSKATVMCRCFVIRYRNLEKRYCHKC